MAEWTLRQAQYFLAVVNHGSVSAAAQAIHVSQGAVSMAMTQLETALGVQLLVRAKAQPARPTAAGLEFAQHVRGILDLVDEATDRMTGSGQQLRGRVMLGVVSTLSPVILPPVLEGFRREWPAVSTAIAELPPMQLQDQVLRGEADVGFLYRQQLTRELDQHVIAPVTLHAVLPADHPAAGRQAVTLAELNGLPAILPDAPPTPQILRALMARQGHDPEVLWASKNAETLRALVGRGLGFSLVNAVPSTEQTFDGGQVRFLPIAGIESHNKVVAVTDPQRRVPRVVKEAIEMARAALEDGETGDRAGRT